MRLLPFRFFNLLAFQLFRIVSLSCRLVVLLSEFARIPFANANLVRIPDEVTDDQAILVSDIFPTGYFGADLAQIHDGDVVTVFGCGPVGQFAIASAFLFNASRVIAVDTLPDRLEMARDQGAEIVDFNAENPVEAIKELTDGTGADRVIDAVGVDAEPPQRGPSAGQSDPELFEQELKKIAPHTNSRGNLWKPGRAPSQVLQWAVESVCKAGTVAGIGVYPETMIWFPFGPAMEKNLTIQAGNCNHRRYIPDLLRIIRGGVTLPEKILTKREPLVSAIEAFQSFDLRKSGWMKVELPPQEDGAMNETRLAAAVGRAGR
ncbi:MAG: zinc-binding dehydrogenase [Limisphaerales bacterium]